MINKLTNLRLVFPRIILIFLPFFLTNGLINRGETESERVCVPQLAAEIDRMIANSENASRWGIVIQNGVSQEVIYQRNANQFFIPASSVKLFTSAVALNQLGADFKVITPVVYEQEGTTLTQLTISGRGDPSLTTKDLEILVGRLKAEGVQSIDSLVLETGYFSQPVIHPTWEWEDVYAAYGTGVNDLILDENAVTLTLRPQGVGEKVISEWDNGIAAAQWELNNRAVTAAPNTDYRIELQGKFATPQLNLTGKLPQHIQRDVWKLAIPDPNSYFRDVFVNELINQGIKVRKVEIRGASLGENVKREEIEIVSPPLRELIQEINGNSNNLYAEALRKVLIAETNLNIVEEELTDLGIVKEDYQLVDGSGLSRRNLVTPNSIVQLLQQMLSHENGEIFRSSLAVGGLEGTLKNRFQATPLEGKIQGKTGTLTGISALSGYVEPSHYELLVFSVILNHSQLRSSQQRAIIDEMLLLVSRVANCSGNDGFIPPSPPS